MKKLFRIFAEELDKSFDRWTCHFDHDRLKDKGEKNENNQRLAGLQRLAQQPHLATEEDVETDTKTLKHTEGAAADRVERGNTSSARIGYDPMCQTSFGREDISEPSALPIYRDDALVDEGTEAPKPCLLSVKICTSTSAAGDLLPTGTAFTLLRAIFPPPPLS